MAGTMARYNTSIDHLASTKERLTCRNSGLKAIMCERKAQWMRLSTQSTCDVELRLPPKWHGPVRNFPVLGI
jgi:hypothetical protein